MPSIILGCAAVRQAEKRYTDLLMLTIRTDPSHTPSMVGADCDAGPPRSPTRIRKTSTAGSAEINPSVRSLGPLVAAFADRSTLPPSFAYAVDTQGDCTRFHVFASYGSELTTPFFLRSTGCCICSQPGRQRITAINQDASKSLPLTRTPAHHCHSTIPSFHHARLPSRSREATRNRAKDASRVPESSCSTECRRRRRPLEVVLARQAPR